MSIYARMTPKVKAAMTFLAQDFAAYLIAYEPSLRIELGDLSEVKDVSSARAARAAFSNAHRRSSEPSEAMWLPIKDVPRILRLDYLLLNTMEAFSALDPAARIASLVTRFASLDDVGWAFRGGQAAPLWQLVMKAGYTLERRGDMLELLGPRRIGAPGRDILTEFPVGVPLPNGGDVQKRKSPRRSGRAAPSQ